MTDYRSTRGRSDTRRSLLLGLVLPLLGFVLGLAAMGWVLTRWDSAARLIGVDPAPVQSVAEAPAGPAATPVEVEPGETQTLLIDPEMQRRVTQLEQRVAGIDNQARAAVGNADRAEGLLVAFAARRALDRGVSLGYIEALLRQRFGDTQRPAVATIITAARQPVTLGALQDELQELAPDLVGVSRDQDWWDALKAELGDLVTVRRSGTPSTMPAERLQRATRALQAGQVDVALAEVLRLPGRENADAWIAQARRYVAARRALDTIETAALLEPRALPPVAAPAGVAPGVPVVPAN